MPQDPTKNAPKKGDASVEADGPANFIREMIAELNVGHAYYREGPDVEETPSVPVGLLGVTRINARVRSLASASMPPAWSKWIWVNRM